MIEDVALGEFLELISRPLLQNPGAIRPVRKVRCDLGTVRSHHDDDPTRIDLDRRRVGDAGEIAVLGQKRLDRLGIDLAAQGKFDEAIAEFREALRLEPDSAETHWNLGLALASRGAPEEAIAHLRRVVQLDPTNGQAHYDLASTLLEARQLEDAVDQFRAALRLMPNSVEAHNNLGLALALQGKLDEAIDQFQRALTFDPEFADARQNLTIALRQRQQLAGDGTP